MKDSDYLAARRKANLQFGDRFLDDPKLQRALKFERNGSIIFDLALTPHLAYYFPSAVGYSLFYSGHFESGEIALCAAALSKVKRPVVLDVGANVGVHAISWASQLSGSHVYAFEPSSANLELLRRNVQQAALEKSVTVVPIAVSDRAGSAVFFDCDDMAYSSLVDTGRRPVVRKYDVDVDTIDAFQARAGLENVDLLKVDVEGTEHAVIAGAAATIERWHPLIFIEIYQGERSNQDPSATIDAICALGYDAFVASDGYVTPFRDHSDAFYNYLFVPKARKFTIPTADLGKIRQIDQERIELILRQERELDELHASLEKTLSEGAEKERAILRLSGELKEKERALVLLTNDLKDKDVGAKRLTEQLKDLTAQLKEKDRALSAITKNAQDLSDQLTAKDAAQQRLLGSAKELRRQLSTKDEAIEALTTSAVALRSQLDEKDQEVIRKDEALRSAHEKSAELQTQLRALAAQLADKEAALVQVNEAAAAVQQQFEALMAQLTEKDQALLEKERAIVEIDQAAREKDRVNFELTAQLKAQYAQNDLFRQAAQERLELIQQLQTVANERLEVIIGLNAQLRQLTA